MRIISDFHDYYDSVMKMGQADDLIYLRKRREIENKMFSTLRSWSWRARSSSLVVKSFVVGFCGKIYGIVKLATDYRGQEKTATCTKIEHIDSFIDQWFSKREAEGYRKRRWSRHSKWHSLMRKEFLEWFEYLEKKRDKFVKFFQENKSPIFVANYNKIEINACLRDIEFYRIMDTYTAFQEIQMWMSNQAEPRKPIPKVSDEDMLLAKGFDKKWSFRKPPQKSKKKSGRK